MLPVAGVRVQSILAGCVSVRKPAPRGRAFQGGARIAGGSGDDDAPGDLAVGFPVGVLVGDLGIVRRRLHVSAAAQTPGDVRFTRISQAGEIRGTTVLLNGTSVPTLSPAWRGTFAWDVLDILGDDGSGKVPKESQAAHGFLERIYNEFRNVGISPQDRALNYSAMNARQTKKVFADMYKETMQLDTVEVDRSTICRPESDCWDVTFRFFNPKEVLTTARMVFQYTIDVSDIVPVPVGRLRKWQVA